MCGVTCFTCRSPGSTWDVWIPFQEPSGSLPELPVESWMCFLFCCLTQIALHFQANGVSGASCLLTPKITLSDLIPRPVRPLNQWWESYYCHKALALDKLQQWQCWQVGGRMSDSQLQISQSLTLLTRSSVVFLNKHFSVLCLWLNSRLLRRFFLTLSSSYIVAFRGRICWPSFSLSYWKFECEKTNLKNTTQHKDF